MREPVWRCINFWISFNVRLSPVFAVIDRNKKMGNRLRLVQKYRNTEAGKPLRAAAWLAGAYRRRMKSTRRNFLFQILRQPVEIPAFITSDQSRPRPRPPVIHAAGFPRVVNSADS